MKKPIQVSIPQPCHENWAAMLPSDKGRFCASCQKNVRDFTRSSDREIASAFAKDKDLCGRFRETQLDRDLVVHSEKSTIWIAAGAAALGFIGLGTHISTAQVAPATEQHEQQMNYVGKPAAHKPLKMTITGTITAFDDPLPLPGAFVQVKGSTADVRTDLDGRYTIEVAPGDILVFYYIGYRPQEVVVGKVTIIDIILNGEPELQGGPMIFRSEQRTFFGRIFHSIGNLFR